MGRLPTTECTYLPTFCPRVCLQKNSRPAFVVASRLRGLVPHPPIPLLYKPPRKASLSRPLFGPKSSNRRLNQNQDPSKGQF